MPADLFAPPAERQTPRTPATPVLFTWLGCGAVVGVSLSMTAQLTGAPDSIALLFGLSPIAAAAIGGWAAYRIDRLLAQDRPALLDANGRSQRPVHAAVFLLPMALCVPAILWAVMVVTVAMTSLTAGMVFGVGGFALGWAAKRVVHRQALAQALQWLEVGEIKRAEEQLERIAHGYWTSRSNRRTAHLNLGLVALTSGDLELAATHYQAVRNGVGATFANAGLALVHALEDRSEAAEDALMAALTSDAATAVQSQTDAVRLLLTLRQEGARAATRLGDSLLTLEAGELFRGLLAFAHLQTGNEGRARDLTDAHTRAGLDANWRCVVPEIAELTVAIG